MGLNIVNVGNDLVMMMMAECTGVSGPQWIISLKPSDHKTLANIIKKIKICLANGFSLILYQIILNQC